MFFKKSFFLLISCSFVVSIFSGSREISKAEEVARQELKNKMIETSAKQEEIRKQEEKIKEEKQKGNDTKQAEEKLIELDKEMQKLLDAKIKAAENVLNNFDSKDQLAIKSKSDAEITRKYIESQIREISDQLASQGTSVNPTKDTQDVLSLGERLSKNLQVWRTTVLAKVYESLGNYATAKKLRDTLVTLYKELNKPSKIEENLLISDRLTLKLGEIPQRLLNNINVLTKYLEDLNSIETKKNKNIKRNPQEKEKIEADAQRARNGLLKPERVSELFETTLILHDALANDVLISNVEKQKLESIEKVLALILMMLDASAEKFKPRTKVERATDAKKQEVVVKKVLAPEEIKNKVSDPLAKLAGENKVTMIKADPFGVQSTKEYKDLISALNVMESIDTTLLSPEKHIELAVVLKNAYEKLSNQYGSFLTDLSDFNKRFTPDQRESLINTLIAVNKKKEIWTNALEEAIQKEKALANENSPEYEKRYKLIEEKNSKARIINQAKLNAAEIAIGSYKETIEKLLDAVTAQKDVSGQIDDGLKKLDQKIEETLREIAKADPSQRSIETLRRIVYASRDLINSIESILKTTDLSYENQIALLKTYLELIVRNDQSLSQLAHDQGSITTVVEDQLVQLPQVERNNVKELHTIPVAPPPPVAQVITNAASAAGKAVDFDLGNSFVEGIKNISLKKTDPSTKGKESSADDLVIALAESLAKIRGAFGPEPESDDDENWD